MAIVSNDLVFYAAANKPEDDTSVGGGAIDVLERVSFVDLAALDALEVVSDNAGDTTQQITVWARLGSGARVNEQVTLNGTTPVQLSTLGTIKDVLRALLDSDAAGTVTVRRTGAGATVATIPPGERGFRRLFIDAFGEEAGGSNKLYYEKVFLRNNHSTLALLNATVTQDADPTGLITFLLAAAQNDTATNTNRVTAPAAVDTLDPDTFDDLAKDVPGTDLGPGDAIGCWLRLQMDAGETAQDSAFTPRLAGSTAA